MGATYLTLHFILTMTLFNRHYGCNSSIDEVPRGLSSFPVVAWLEVVYARAWPIYNPTGGPGYL